MTRSTAVTRESEEAKEYVYWFETSGSTFMAWTLNREFPLQLRTQAKQIVNGVSFVKPWELRMDVSGKQLKEPFLLRVQAQAIDAFVRRSNWWIGMKVTDDMEAASMRILLPQRLKYRNAEFTSHPNNTASQVETFEGITLNSTESQELLWTVEKPRKGWTYRVQWDW